MYPTHELLGGTALVYRYTVVGSDKTSIDTAVDTPDAGTNVWSGGDLLEVFIYARTDEAAVASNILITLNNDTSTSHYDGQFVEGANTTTAANKQTAFAGWVPPVAGASAGTSIFGPCNIVIPNYAGTVGFKTGTMMVGFPDTTSTNMQIYAYVVGFRDTAAITRLALSVLTAAKKLKVGSQITIYKRLAG